MNLVCSMQNYHYSILITERNLSSDKCSSHHNCHHHCHCHYCIHCHHCRHRSSSLLSSTASRSSTHAPNSNPHHHIRCIWYIMNILILMRQTCGKKILFSSVDLRRAKPPLLPPAPLPLPLSQPPQHHIPPPLPPPPLIFFYSTYGTYL